jgi:hypothetical protein
VSASPQPSGSEWQGHNASLPLNDASSEEASEFQPSQELLSSAYNPAAADHTPSQEVEDRDEEATALYIVDTGALEDDEEDDEEDAATGAEEEPVPSKETELDGDVDIDLPPLRFEPPPHRPGSPPLRRSVASPPRQPQRSPLATRSLVRGNIHSRQQHGNGHQAVQSTEAR